MKLRLRDLPALARSARRLRETSQAITPESILAVYLEDHPPTGDLDGIDWEALLAFIEKVLPLILALLQLI